MIRRVKASGGALLSLFAPLTLFCSVVLSYCMFAVPNAYAGNAQDMQSVVAISRAAPLSGSGRRVIAEFTAEQAATPESRLKGLSGREGMPVDSGMLFILDQEQQSYFWMRGMKFPLDILIFDREKKLVKIFQDLPPCDVCPVYAAPAGSAYALEICAGMTKKHGLQVGDSLVIK